MRGLWIPLPPSITQRIFSSILRPRLVRLPSSSVHRRAFSDWPSQIPSGAFVPTWSTPSATTTVWSPTLIPSSMTAMSFSVSRGRAMYSFTFAAARLTRCRLPALLLAPRARTLGGALARRWRNRHTHRRHVPSPGGEPGRVRGLPEQAPFGVRPCVQGRVPLLSVETLAALANAVALIGISGYILFEAYGRFLHPPDIASGPMLVVAAFGLAVNLAGIVMVRSGASGSLNLKGAYFEVLSDLLSSGAVIAAAIIIWTTGWYYVDPILSIGIGLSSCRTLGRCCATWSACSWKTRPQRSTSRLSARHWLPSPV